MTKKTQTIFLSILILFCNATYAKTLGHEMKDNTLIVVIEKPISEVFEFTTNPHNTPKWINSIAVEQTNQWPPKVETIYKNRGKSGPWSVYEVTKYIKDKEFELAKQDQSTYHVNYAYFTLANGATKLVYHEWVINGYIDGPFTQDALEKLKTVMEGKQKA